MNIAKIANSIANKARAIGYAVNVREASTGTMYLTCSNALGDTIIRVADHAELYATAHVSVAPGDSREVAAITLLRTNVAEAPETIENKDQFIARHSAEIEAQFGPERVPGGKELFQTLRSQALAAGFDRTAEYRQAVCQGNKGQFNKALSKLRQLLA